MREAVRDVVVRAAHEHAAELACQRQTVGQFQEHCQRNLRITSSQYVHGAGQGLAAARRHILLARVGGRHVLRLLGRGDAGAQLQLWPQRHCRVVLLLPVRQQAAQNGWRYVCASRISSTSSTGITSTIRNSSNNRTIHSSSVGNPCRTGSRTRHSLRLLGQVEHAGTLLLGGRLRRLLDAAADGGRAARGAGEHRPHGGVTAEPDERAVADGVVVVVEQLELAAAVALAQLALAPVRVVRTVHRAAAEHETAPHEECLQRGVGEGGAQLGACGSDLAVASGLWVRREGEDDVVLDEGEKDEVKDDGHEHDEEGDGGLVRRGVAEEEAGCEEREMSLQGYAGAEEEDDEEKERVGRDERDVLRHLHPHLE